MHHKKRFSLVGKWREVDLHHSLVESSELGPTTRKTKAHSSHKLIFLFMTMYNIAVPHISCLKLKGWIEDKNYTSTVGQTFTFFGPHPGPNFWKTENGSTADFQVLLRVTLNCWRVISGFVLMSFFLRTALLFEFPLLWKATVTGWKQDHRSSAHSACAETS